MKKITAALIILLAAFQAVSAATAVEVTALTDRTSAKLGDVIRYTLSIKRTGDLSQSPALSLPSFEGFRVAGSYSNNSMSIINGAAAATTQQIIDLLAVKSGAVVIDPSKVRFYNPETKQYENIETKAITIQVAGGGRHAASQTPTVAALPTAVPDIRGIKMSYQIDFTSLLPYIIIAVIFLAVLYFAYKKLFKKPAAIHAVIPEDDFRKEAARKLKAARELLKKGDVKGYYSGIYEAIRFFISKKHSDTFDELTTQEIVRKLAEKNIKEEGIKPVYELMKDCDLVKFADYKPADKEADEAYARAEAIIEK